MNFETLFSLGLKKTIHILLVVFGARVNFCFLEMHLFLHRGTLISYQHEKTPPEPKVDEQLFKRS